MYFPWTRESINKTCRQLPAAKWTEGNESEINGAQTLHLLSHTSIVKPSHNKYSTLNPSPENLADTVT